LTFDHWPLTIDFELETVGLGLLKNKGQETQPNSIVNGQYSMVNGQWSMVKKKGLPRAVPKTAIGQTLLF